MSGCKPVETPMNLNTKLMPQTEKLAVDKGRYQHLVGKLIYLTHTRLDISFAVSIVSQFLGNPSIDHLEAVNRILKYLKKDLGKGLMFRKTINQTLEVLREKELCILINLQRRKHTYLYSSVREKKEIKLEFN